jgi:hypothetical protein
MANVLKITFNGVPDVNDEIELHYDANYPALPFFDFTRANVFKTTRVNPGEVTIGTDDETQAENYALAFMLDYGVSFTVFQEGNVVYIQANNGSVIFDYSSDSGLIAFELVTEIPFEENMIHIINITPRQYATPSGLERNYLVTEDDFLILTEDNNKIRL